MTRKTRWWLLGWTLLSLALAAGLLLVLLRPAPTPLRSLFTPGPMTQGHHGIELACDACHTQKFGGGPVLQQACVNCHGAALADADDSHPKAKFSDPRNADRLKVIDARQCLSCHVEHRPEMTGAMGVTVPQDFCYGCHAEIGQERPTHKDFKFDSCASAGCHNFHDNRALYEDFLLKHLHEPSLLEKRQLQARDFDTRWVATHGAKPLTTPDHGGADPATLRDWLETAHAQAGVNCTACHAPQKQSWTDRPPPQACKNCHAREVEGFFGGKHGMREAAGLPAMTPAQARLPMQPEAAHRQLGCGSCHGAHRFATRSAAVDSCLGCHADRHSLAFKDSPHFKLWQREQAGELPAGSGVSCASCHLPRLAEDHGGQIEVRVEHNQNVTLQPNEKMLRPVCMQCHGLGFAIDALADRELIGRNFRGAPAAHIPSLDMAKRAFDADQSRRESGSKP